MKKIKDLGLLDDDLKQVICWRNGAISGSKINNIFKDADKTIKEDLGYLEKQDLNADPIIREKLKMGTYMENLILDLAKKEWNIEPIILKNTFEIEGTNYYANIDGIAKDKSCIYEVKNSETDDVNILFERYKWQGVYYCWFFNIPKVVFIFFIRGYKLRRYEYMPSPEDYQALEAKINDFNKAFNENIPDYFINTQQAPQEFIIDNPEAEAKLAELIEIKEQKTALEARDKELRTYFAEALDNDISIFKSEKLGYKIQLQKQTRKQGFDTEKIFSDYPEISRELYKKPDYVLNQVRMFKLKKE